MRIRAYSQFCILMLCIYDGVGLSQPVVVHSLFYHKDPLLSAPYSMELIVLYASGKIPTICAVDEHSVAPATMMQRKYRIQPVLVDSSVMKRFPLISDHGYTVRAQQRGTSLELVVTYDSLRLMVGLSTFNTIGNQGGCALHLCPITSIVSRRKKTHMKKVVILDAGHGGKDTGALSASGMQEKELALAMALRIQKLLEAHGITVIMTRTTDSDMSLDERTSLANKHSADLFVSLHANYAVNARASGIETWYILPKVHILSACSDAKAIGYIQDTLRHRSAVSHIPASYTHKALMGGVQHCYSHVLNRHVKAAISQVLLGCRMPSFLIELGFLSNGAESTYLMSHVYQDIQARSISTGIVDYFTYLDKLD